MGNFAQNTGNLLKSLIQSTGGNISRGWDVVSQYLGNQTPDVTSNNLISPVPQNAPPPTMGPIQQPAQQVPQQSPQSNTVPRMTYYLPTGNPTASGTTPQSGYTMAVSRELLKDIPMGTLIKLADGTIRRVEDVTDSDIKNTFDLFFSTQEEGMAATNGLSTDVPYETVGRDLSGLLYNIGR
jgi:3D (Asp-Asp-Asp) domain-containing protein